MANRETVRGAARLGLVGSILVLTMVLAPIGGVLLLIAMRRLSRGFGDGLIWRYALYSLLVGVAGIAALIPISILMAMYVGVNPLYPSPNSITYNVAYAILVVVFFTHLSWVVITSGERRSWSWLWLVASRVSTPLLGGFGIVRWLVWFLLWLRFWRGLPITMPGGVLGCSWVCSALSMLVLLAEFRVWLVCLLARYP